MLKFLNKSILQSLVACLLLLSILLLPVINSQADTKNGKKTTTVLPDLSGLAWIKNDLFLGVHDAKNSAKKNQPRVSFIWLPQGKEGVLWQPINLDWKDALGASNDLESVSSIPGTSLFLLVESGGDFQKVFHRIFLAEYQQNNLKIIDVVQHNSKINNVEGTAVARLGETLIFLYAERAEGEPQTQICWTTLALNPLRFGKFQEVTFSSPEPRGKNARQIIAMEVDNQGKLYIASATDSHNDNGSFRSVVWQIGNIQPNQAGNPEVVLAPQPQHLATVDGFKVESLAMRIKPNQETELFMGTDDENYGGVLRLIP